MASSSYKSPGKSRRNRVNAVECGVCEDVFALQGEKVPRLLLCGHTLCHECLTRLPINSQVILCPFDRQATELRDSGVWGLKKNFALLELLERLQLSSQSAIAIEGDHEEKNICCDENEEHSATVYCTVCGTHLCDECALEVHKTKTLARHKRVPIAEKPHENPMCPLHLTHVIELTCLEEACQDNPLMCFVCKDYGKHQGHKHALLENEAGTVRNSVIGAVQRMEGFIEEVEESAKRLISVIEEIEGGLVMRGDPQNILTPTNIPGTAEDARARVRAYFDDLRETVNRQEEAGLLVVDNFVREKLCSLRQQQEDMAVLISQVTAVTVECNRAVQKSDTEVLQIQKHLHSLLETVHTQQQQFSEITGLCQAESSIPVHFTKDNRVHIGPKMEMRIVALGLDGAGKTSILFKLKQDEFVSTITTIGFNVETVEHKSMKFTIWDVGGLQKLRPLWRHYYLNTQAVIFVIDSSNAERIAEAHDELAKLMAEKRLKDALLLVYANKQDLPNSFSVDEVTERLGLHKLCCGRSWNILGCDAHSGQGLHEGLDWLARQLMSEFAQ